MGRGLDVLTALAGFCERPPYRAAVVDIAAELGRERSQVSRTLHYLVEHGLAVRSGKQYEVSWDWYAQAQAVTSRRLRTDGLTVLESLAVETGEAVFLSLLQGDSTVTIVESVPASTGLVGSWLGRAFPAFCSDAGQAVLWDADDDEVRAVFSATTFSSLGPNAPADVEDFLTRLHAARERSYSVVDQEAELDLFSVAAPVRDYRDEVVAGVQVVGLRDRLVERVEELGAACVRAASELSVALGAA